MAVEMILTKAANGTLMPTGPGEAEELAKIKVGAAVRCSLVRMRNPIFHRKWFALAGYAYEMWRDTMPTVKHKGEAVQPNFERFRKDLTILAGFYDTVFNVHGELRLEAQSISFSNMDGEVFEKLYSATINAILQKILTRQGLTEEKLRNYVDQVMSFD